MSGSADSKELMRISTTEVTENAEGKRRTDLTGLWPDLHEGYYHVGT